MSEPTPGSESTRDLPGQRSPGDSHFSTPAWVGPTRHASEAPSIPVQGTPAHRAESAESGAPSEPSTRPADRERVVESAHWVGSSTGRTAASLMLIAALIVTLGMGALTYSRPGADSVALLVASALVVMAIWGLMAASKPMIVDLNGPMLTVRHHNTQEVFDLSDPYQSVEIRGAVGSPTWSLTLERRDGSPLVVGSRTVNVHQLHPTVLYHRKRAELRRTERESRFNR